MFVEITIQEKKKIQGNFQKKKFQLLQNILFVLGNNLTNSVSLEWLNEWFNSDKQTKKKKNYASSFWDKHTVITDFDIDGK